MSLNRMASLASENLAKAPLSPMAARISGFVGLGRIEPLLLGYGEPISASHASLSEDVLRGFCAEGRML